MSHLGNRVLTELDSIDAGLLVRVLNYYQDHGRKEEIKEDGWVYDLIERFTALENIGGTYAVVVYKENK